jgi:putative Mg2+ transporter-C (MgtC) family protein
MIGLFGIEIDWWHGIQDFITILVAYMLAVPIGWHRLRAERGFGLPTYPLVAIASCTFLLIGEAMPGTAKADPRLIQGLMTGIGFLGTGAILKRGERSTASPPRQAFGVRPQWVPRLPAIIMSSQRF